MPHVKQAVILAGGRGTRLSPLTQTTPKPMVDVNGKPFLAHLLELIEAQGISEVLILTGYLGEQIEAYFGDGTSGLKIKYSWATESTSTGDRILAANDLLDTSFLLLYSDNYVRFDLEALGRVQKLEGFPVVLTVYPKAAGNINLRDHVHVEEYLQDRSSGSGQFVEVGFSLVNRDALIDAIGETMGSLPGALEQLAISKMVGACVVEHPYFSVSDLSRLGITRNALTPRKVLLLDRDGVINIKAEKGTYISDKSEFVPIDTTWSALRILAESGFRFLIISNQAGLARGMVSEENLKEIHQLMVTQLGEIGVEVIEVYVCPHHWDAGCACRKPKPGMFFTAAAKHGLLLDRMVYVGDDIRDESAAIAAGCTPLIIGPERLNVKNRLTLVSKDLLDAVPSLLQFYSRNPNF